MSDSPLTLASSDFDLFGLTVQFAQDRTAVDERWKQLQREAHPDKFAAQDGTAQRLAMQWSVRINQAYQRLKDPLKRAAYLCELAGAPVNAENNTAMSAHFLQQQMQWREDLDDATGPGHLDALQTSVDKARQQALSECARLLDSSHDAVGAVGWVRALMFIERFAADLEDKAEKFASDARASAGSSH
ncbi:MAG: Fe-S protein assembly co-chaperone HscB [Rhodoferax sp.]|nr:Fe-S protein assembly co-chaperone HscB [Rhodoferax sp.]